MPERFANKAFTTLNEASGIDDNTNPVTFTVSNPAAFPASGNFRVKIDEEILLVTSVAGSDFTATRGVEGSPITEHYNGAGIRHIVTAGGLTQAFNDRFLSGTYASLPPAGFAGRKYYCTDSPYTLIDNGVDWLHFVNHCLVEPPVLADFTWENQSTATAVDTYGGVYMENMDSSRANSHNLNMLLQTVPNTPYSIVLGYIPKWDWEVFGLNGGALRNSTNGKISAVRTSTETNMNLHLVVEHYNDPNTSTGLQYVYENDVYLGKRNPIYVKIEDDGTIRKFYYSTNPFNFPLLVGSYSNTTHMTTDQVGFYLNNYNTVQSCHYIHWKIGS
jgi:hypothetical protein